MPEIACEFANAKIKLEFRNVRIGNLLYEQNCLSPDQDRNVILIFRIDISIFRWLRVGYEHVIGYDKYNFYIHF